MSRNILLGILLIVSLSAVAYAQAPSGVLVDVGTPEHWQNKTAGNVTAEGGNITEVNITASVSTYAWQGFYGDVSNDITLEDNSANRLYAWAVTNNTGSLILTSRNSTIDWSSVVGVDDCTIDEDITGTGTDRVNNTFTNTTVDFTIATVAITEACSTFTFVNNATQTDRYEEIIVNATDVPSIYVTKVNTSTIVFNGELKDYQMIVPANTSLETYYFFFEFI